MLTSLQFLSPSSYHLLLYTSLHEISLVSLIKTHVTTFKAHSDNPLWYFYLKILNNILCHVIYIIHHRNPQSLNSSPLSCILPLRRFCVCFLTSVPFSHSSYILQPFFIGFWNPQIIISNFFSELDLFSEHFIYLFALIKIWLSIKRVSFLQSTQMVTDFSPILIPLSLEVM